MPQETMKKKSNVKMEQNIKEVQGGNKERCNRYLPRTHKGPSIPLLLGDISLSISIVVYH